MSEILLRYIRDGIKAVDFFDYDGIPLSIRPLTTSEIDDAKMKGYKYLDPKVAGIIVKMNLDMISGKEPLKEVHEDLYINIDKFQRELAYWVVYHGMKDFMPSDFTIDDVRKMRFVHDISRQILNMSSTNSDTVIAFVSSPEGEEIAKIIYMYNVPLIKQLSDATPLQLEFLKWSHPKTPKKIASSFQELGNVLPELGRILNESQSD